MPMARLRFITNTAGDRGAVVVQNRLSRAYDLTAVKREVYHKGGHQLFMEQDIAGDWPLAVIDAIGLAQRVGYGWALSGDIRTSLDMTTTRLRESGATFATLLMEREEEPNQ